MVVVRNPRETDWRDGGPNGAAVRWGLKQIQYESTIPQFKNDVLSFREQATSQVQADSKFAEARGPSAILQDSGS